MTCQYIKFWRAVSNFLTPMVLWKNICFRISAKPFPPKTTCKMSIPLLWHIFEQTWDRKETAPYKLPVLNRTGFFPLKLKSGKFYISLQFCILIIVNLRARMYYRHQNDADPQHSNIFFEKWIWDLCEYRFHIWMKTKICHWPLVGYVLGKNEVISTENVAPCPP